MNSIEDMKHNVLFSIEGGTYPKIVGGMEVFNYYLIRGLSQKSAHIYYTAHSEYNFHLGHHLKTYALRPQKIFWPLQDFIHLLCHPSIKSYVISYSEAHWLIWYLFSVIARILRLDLIIVIHHGKSTPAKNHEVYKKFFNTAKNVIAVSPDIKKNYDAAYGIDCTIIYPIVPFETTPLTKEECRTKYNIPLDATVISMVGTIKRMKNPDILIKALAGMSEEKRYTYNLYAIFAGSGPMVEQLQEMANALGIADRVRFLGLIPKDSINEIMMLTDIYLIASDYEGTSVSLLEAMFNKKNIIISRVPGLIDMVEEGIDALAFETGNQLQLTHCICNIVEYPHSSAQRAESAYRKYLAKYNFEDVLQKYISIL